jgi:glutathione peroxidase
MKSLLITGILIMTFIVGTSQTKNLHQFKVTSIDGKEFDLASLKGKKVMIVNTASKCGFTPQYKTLQELYENYGGEKFEIVGFPANNFMNQEPGSNSDIRGVLQRQLWRHLSDDVKNIGKRERYSPSIPMAYHKS